MLRWESRKSWINRKLQSSPDSERWCEGAYTGFSSREKTAEFKGEGVSDEHEVYSTREMLREWESTRIHLRAEKDRVLC